MKHRILVENKDNGEWHRICVYFEVDIYVSIIIFVNFILQTFINLNIMRPEFKYFRTVVWMAFMFLSVSVFSQSIGDAKKIFNEAAEAIKADNKVLAIEKLEACIEITNTLYEEEEDEEAEALMYDAREKVPKLYFSIAKDKLTAKDYKGGLEAALKAKESAEEYDDEETAKKANKEIAKVYAKMGISKLKKKDAGGAIKEFDKSIEVNPDFAKIYQYKALAYKSLKDDANFKTTSNKGIEVAERTNDKTTKNNIVKQAFGYYFNKGVKEKGASKYEPAVAYFKTALEYKPKSADASYALASSYQSLNKFDDALSASEMALSNESSSVGKAKIYLLQAQVYEAKGDNAAACETYPKAAVGQYAEIANYQIEHVLKCNE